MAALNRMLEKVRGTRPDGVIICEIPRDEIWPSILRRIQNNEIVILGTDFEKYNWLPESDATDALAFALKNQK